METLRSPWQFAGRITREDGDESCCPPPPSGTGNVNIEEAEKLLRPYLKRYPKVSLTSWQTPAAHMCPVDPHKSRYVSL